MDAVPLFLTTLGLTVGIAFLLTKGNLQQIQSEWSTRRCELPVMIMGQLFKPADDPRSPSEFAQENFDFCSRMYVKQVFTAMLTPLFAILGKQLDVTKLLGEGTNLMRTVLAAAAESFRAIIDPFYRRFMMIGYHFAQVYKKIMNAMERVYGAMVASLYLGISLFRGVLNFKDLVVKIVLIIMGILIAGIILLFFILIPVLPVVITTVAVLAAGGIGVAGASAFCFAPETEVVLADGKSKPICMLNVGDKCKEGGYVEGILLTEREPNTVLYSYKGIVVSGAHMVYENKQWMFVEQSDLAVPIETTTGRLYSLRTSRREMICRNDQGDDVLFRDWEELPQGDAAADAEWDRLVQQLLQNTLQEEDVSDQDPLFSPYCLVQNAQGERVPLYTIKIGDSVRTVENTVTRVLGIYRGLVFGKAKDPAWSTDGVWWKQQDGNWHHRSSTLEESEDHCVGLHLITDAGTFWVETSSTVSGIVRDFTEVGHLSLPLTKPFLLSRLNEKPNV